MSNTLSKQYDVSQQFALDTQGLETLKHSARAGGAAGAETLKAAARQFEAVFTNMMLKSMRDATPQDGPFNNEQTKMYMSMLDQQMAQHLSTRGIGLADVMARQLSQATGTPLTQGGASDPMGQAAASLAGVLDSRGGDGSPDAAEMPRAGTVVPGASWNPTAGLRQYQAAGDTGAWQGGTGALPDDAPTHVAAFVSRMAGPAQAASQSTGVPARLILGQAALESGWGKREIAHPDGATTHNVFGIKAGANWKGPVAEITTTEYIDGAPQKVKARFRAYASYDEAFADYARLLANNPRYSQVLNAGSADEAAHGLQRAGYATDPAYGEKLVRIMRKVST